jgi:hypothetical protein
VRGTGRVDPAESSLTLSRARAVSRAGGAAVAPLPVEASPQPGSPGISGFGAPTASLPAPARCPRPHPICPTTLRSDGARPGSRGVLGAHPCRPSCEEPRSSTPPPPSPLVPTRRRLLLQGYAANRTATYQTTAVAAASARRGTPACRSAVRPAPPPPTGCLQVQHSPFFCCSFAQRSQHSCPHTSLVLFSRSFTRTKICQTFRSHISRKPRRRARGQRPTTGS